MAFVQNCTIKTNKIQCANEEKKIYFNTVYSLYLSKNVAANCSLTTILTHKLFTQVNNNKRAISTWLLYSFVIPKELLKLLIGVEFAIAVDTIESDFTNHMLFSGTIFCIRNCQNVQRIIEGNFFLYVTVNRHFTILCEKERQKKIYMNDSIDLIDLMEDI